MGFEGEEAGPVGEVAEGWGGLMVGDEFWGAVGGWGLVTVSLVIESIISVL